MDTSLFIASRLRFKGKIAMVCIAVSFLVMIVAVAISSGFRHELHSSLSEISGDILLSTPDLNVMNESRPIDSSSPCMDYVESSELVERVVPVTWRAGIVRHDGNMHGVVLKGVPSHPEFTDSVSLGVSVPRKLASASGLKVGDRITVSDMDGAMTDYIVVAMDVLLPTAVEEMTAGEYDLTLFTCTYGGENRVTARCEKAE